MNAQRRRANAAPFLFGSPPPGIGGFFVAIGDNALFIRQAYASCGSSQLTATIVWD